LSDEPSNLLENSNLSELKSYEDKFQKLTRWDVSGEAFVGSGAAGAVYILIAGSVLMFNFGPYGILPMLLLWPFLMVLGFFVGAFSAVIASMIVIPLNASLDWPLNSLWQNFVVGGLAGFFSTAPILLAISLNSDASLFFIIIGPFTAMTIGHLGGYWSTRKVVSDHNSRVGVQQYELEGTTLKTSRYSITHIMIFTAWVALGFAFLSALPPEISGFVLAMYLGSQLAAGLLAALVIWIVAAIGRGRRRSHTEVQH